MREYLLLLVLALILWVVSAVSLFAGSGFAGPVQNGVSGPRRDVPTAGRVLDGRACAERATAGPLIAGVGK